MPIDPNQFQTGGALQSAVAASLLQYHDASSELKLGDRIGPFRVVRELGRGGMAIVYLAERDDGEYQQRIALKWMQGELSGAAGEALFRRERQALADLRHPHIARLLDGGRTVSGRPWFAMEYIEGQPLDRHCFNQRLPQKARLALFLQVCSAVAFAHAHGVLHRDIKPSNVLVDTDGSTRLLDFGIAQLLGDEDRLAPRAFTPGFASPEQVAGEPLSAASDVYQLGRLLAAIMSENEADFATFLANAAVPTSGNVRPDGELLPVISPHLPADLVAILTMACRSEPSQRYATVEALAEDIRAVLDNRPVTARPRTARYLMGRFIQRHPWAVAASIAGFFITLSATAVFVISLQAERDAADHQARIATTVLDFVRQDLLAAADPSAAPGEELSVRKALDMASATVGSRFADLPVEQAAIRDTLAALYHELGRYEEAEREARQALALNENEDVPALQRRTSLTHLAWISISRDRLDEADAVLARLLAGEKSTSPKTLLQEVEAALIQGVILHQRGEYESARKVLDKALNNALPQLEANDPLILQLSSRLATSLFMLGRHDEALPLLQQIHQKRWERLGQRHPLTLVAAHELGVLLRHRGELDQALAFLEPTLVVRRDVLGPSHPETLSTSNEIATVYQDQKRYAEAEPLFRNVLDQRTRSLGEDHIKTRNSMSNLGLLYSLWNRPEDAAPLYERALTLETARGGEMHPDTIALIHNIAGLYRKQSRLNEALAMHQRALDAAKAHPDLGPDAWQTAMFHVGHAQTLHQAGREQEADAEMTRSITILSASLGAQHPRTRRAQEIQANLRTLRK